MNKPASTTTTVEVSYQEAVQEESITRDVALGVGEVLTLMLGASGSTGYHWAEPQIGNSAVLHRTPHEHVSGHTIPLVGAPRAQVWTFTALQAGTTTIASDLHGPLGDSQLACSFKANITVH